MKKLTAIIAASILILTTTSCKKDLIGDGPIRTETRTVPEFTAIDLKMNGDVYYKKSGISHVEVSAKESLHSIIETSVNGGRLTIRYSNGKTYDADPSIRITVYSPNVNSFELNTSGSIYVPEDITPTNLFARTAGSGSIHLQKVTSTEVEAIVSQSGNITVSSGTALNVKCKATASGTIDLGNLAAHTGQATTGGSGDVLVNVSNSLHATIHGSGDIYFMGNPALTTHISGSGNVRRL